MKKSEELAYILDVVSQEAELTPEEKNQISHRGKALREMKELLRKQAL